VAARRGRRAGRPHGSVRRLLLTSNDVLEDQTNKTHTRQLDR
jgi:hypothetical protein